jgi:hypothetical protein
MGESDDTGGASAPITRQEMLDRAVRGLRGQGWRQAMVETEIGYKGCKYMTPDGRRCAWGHVDPEGTGRLGSEGITVRGLWEKRVGVAATLDPDGLSFATDLQQVHDNHGIELAPEELEAAFREFAALHKLSFPEAEDAIARAAAQEPSPW